MQHNISHLQDAAKPRRRKKKKKVTNKGRPSTPPPLILSPPHKTEPLFIDYSQQEDIEKAEKRRIRAAQRHNNIRSESSSESKRRGSKKKNERNYYFDDCNSPISKVSLFDSDDTKESEDIEEFLFDADINQTHLPSSPPSVRMAAGRAAFRRNKGVSPKQRDRQKAQKQFRSKKTNQERNVVLSEGTPRVDEEVGDIGGYLAGLSDASSNEYDEKETKIVFQNRQTTRENIRVEVNGFEDKINAADSSMNSIPTVQSPANLIPLIPTVYENSTKPKYDFDKISPKNRNRIHAKEKIEDKISLKNRNRIHTKEKIEDFSTTDTKTNETKRERFERRRINVRNRTEDIECVNRNSGYTESDDEYNSNDDDMQNIKQKNISDEEYVYGGQLGLKRLGKKSEMGAMKSFISSSYPTSNNVEQMYYNPSRSENDENKTHALLRRSIKAKPVSIADAIKWSDIRTFLTSPVPREFGLVETFIIRDKRRNTKYFCFLDDGKKFIMAAKRRKHKKLPSYVISCNKHDLSREGSGFIGKVRSNGMRPVSSYTVCDDGIAPRYVKSLAARKNARRDLLNVVFQKGASFSVTPREMRVSIPAIEDDGTPYIFRPLVESQSILLRAKARDSKLLYLGNKTPRYNEEQKSYVLDFGSRVTTASIKNFQLIAPGYEDNILMQFGRSGSNKFTMDFKWPLSPIQAFGLVLSCFEV